MSKTIGPVKLTYTAEIEELTPKLHDDEIVQVFTHYDKVCVIYKNRDREWWRPVSSVRGRTIYVDWVRTCSPEIENLC